ncbi:class I SAM-dependent methyltransferase [Pseudonocardia sp. TRM90224]|uniref:class I SAM-dependent methyltransferase n=1 Tax=Pseudonocardia sp. TRM90224 TaxID=2812678 RepID=UPI001E4C3CE5|nr:class I SAM-dependent methyltransferase [Pseudonocardia sp. TRM90224]
MTVTAAQRWARLQDGRGIPPEILAQAERTPWRHDVDRFVAPEIAEDTASRAAALGLLGAGGTVLDVGCGGGAAALALAGAATHVTGVDRQPDMLEAFAATAARRGAPHRTVLGSWPDAAAAAGRADVVVCHHVLHNVVDLPPFLEALTAAAGRGVVVEMFTQHPMAWLDPLWLRFHDLRRPPSATSADAVAVLAELGITATATEWERRPSIRQDVAWITRQLCLPAGRAGEVEAALAETPARPTTVATLTW